MEKLEEQINIRTLEKNPEFFGSFLNLASENLEKILSHASSQRYFSINDPRDVITSFNTEDKAQEHHGLFKFLKFYLPCLRIFDPEDLPKSKKIDQNNTINVEPINYQVVYEFLSGLKSDLDSLRNNFSHYLSFDRSKEEFSSRSYCLSDRTKYHVQRLFELAPQYSFFNYQSTQLGVADRFEEEDFNHLKAYQLFEGDSNALSLKGVAFVCCLLLNKSSALLFLKKLKGFKNETSAPFRATISTYAAYCAKKPTEKIVSHQPVQQLLLDMLNELGKCPRQLYRLLTEQDQEKFKPNLGETELQNVLDNSVNFEDFDEIDFLNSFGIKKRSQDRFNYFAIRFIDELNLLPSYKFQINLGKLVVKEPYRKELSYKTVDRKIVEEKRVFGSLNYCLNNREELETLMTDNEQSYFEQYHPHYNIVDNKIALINSGNQGIVTNDNDRSNVFFISLNEMPKLVYLLLQNPNQFHARLNKFYGRYKKILDTSNLYDLKAKMNYSFLSRHFEEHWNNDRWETKKRKWYKTEILSRQKALANELGFRTNYLPKKIQDFVLNITTNNNAQKVKEKANELFRETDRRLKRLDQDRIHKSGEIASFIAQDMLYMIVSEHCKKKITSIYYQELQRMLAHFSGHKDELLQLCHELNLFNRNSGHVFLRKEDISSSRGILDFYQKYLKQRLTWIKPTQPNRRNPRYRPKRLDQYKTLPYKINKAIHDHNEKLNIDRWVKRARTESINIPVGLFDDYILKDLRNKCLSMNISFRDTDRFASLLEKYLLNDTQPFYQYLREYRVKTKTEELTYIVDLYKDGQKLKGLEICVKYGERFDKAEKEISLIQMQDRLIKLMCTKLLDNQEYMKIDVSQFKLKDYSPGEIPKILKQPASFEQSIPSTNHVVFAQDHSEVLAQEYNYVWKLKDYGRFKHLLYDRRVKNLLAHFDTSRVCYEYVQKELEEYDRYRALFFEHVFDLEKCIYKKDSKTLVDIWKLDYKYTKQREIPFRCYIEWLRTKDLSFDEELINRTRNCFFHGDFPENEHLRVSKVQHDMFYLAHYKSYKQGNVNRSFIQQQYQSITSQYYALYGSEIKQIINAIKGAS